MTIEDRALEFANHIITTGSTIRETAFYYKTSKSTVHKDVSERLLKINPAVAYNVREVLDRHKEERAMKGGMATKQKWIQSNHRYI